MRVLQYKNLNLDHVRSAFGKVKAAIEADDFRSADVKKLNSGGYYRAKLDYANRLLLRFARVPTAGGPDETVCLALEIIENHAYDRSRFLRGAAVDYSAIESAATLPAAPEAIAPDTIPLRWAGRERTQFELLDNDWVDLGCKTSTLPMPGPAESFQLAERMAAAPDLKRRTRPAS
jgi:hypothetical protein